MSHARLNDLAQTIIDSNRYMVLGTADQAGHPLGDGRVVLLAGLHALPLGLVARAVVRIANGAPTRNGHIRNTRTRSGTPRDAATLTRTSRFADRRVPRDRACTSVTLR